MLGLDVNELMLRWYVVDSNLTLFDQLADVGERRATLGPTSIADDEEIGSIVIVQRCGLEFCLERQLHHHF